jgi:uncharacterized SAM-binding protein YcdF (DUF218 family)
MHQIASYFIGLLASPLHWILILLFFYFYNKRSRKKIFVIAAGLIFLVFSNSWILNAYARYWQNGLQQINTSNTYSCGILLGGFASPDENDQGYFNQSSDRFIQTVKLYQTHTIQHILISGGNGKKESKEFNEGAWVRNELIAMGVPDSVILFEDQSTNTADNAQQSKKILTAAGLKAPYVIISSAHHLPRAQLIFKNAGVETIPFPSHYIAGKEKFSWTGIIPNIDVLLTWNDYLKEAFGYAWYRVK